VSIQRIEARKATAFVKASLGQNQCGPGKSLKARVSKALFKMNARPGDTPPGFFILWIESRASGFLTPS
jgi:hypothetical protein